MPKSFRAELIVCLMRGTEPDRSFQIKSFLTQVMERASTPSLLKLSLPLARYVIDEIDPANTTELCNELLDFCRAHLTNREAVSWAYKDLEDPEADWYTDLAKKFVIEWYRQRPQEFVPEVQR